MKKILLCGGLAAVLFAACSEDPAVSPADARGYKVSFRAGTEQTDADRGSRAGYDGVKSVWHAGDELGVTFGADNNNLKFTQTDGTLADDGTSVEFEGTLNQPLTGNVSAVAYFPYSATASVSGQTVTTDFPATQNYVESGYKGLPLFGRYDGDIEAMQFRFRNLFSVIKISLAKDASVTGTLMLRSIEFTGNNNETVSGAMSVDMSGSTPAVTYSGTGKTITLDCGSGVELNATPKAFYIAVPALNYSRGYTLTMKTDQGQLTKKVKLMGADYAANTIYATPDLAVKDLVTPFIILDANLRGLLEGLGLIDVLDPLTGSVSVTALGLAATSIDLSGGDISVVAGLGNFPNLATLNVSNNNLASLDVSANPLLATLNCSGNQLTSLDVTHNPLLATLDCSGNQLVSLDVTSNPALLTLDCSTNLLTSVDVHSNTLLTTLKCYGNTLTTLNISNLPALVNLGLVNGTNSIALKVLTVPAAATVRNLVSDGGIWLTFECKNNPTIQTISLKNNAALASLTVTGNVSLTSLDLTNTPLLLAYTASGNASGFKVVGKGGIL